MHAILRGCDHTELDQTVATTVADDLAIALSRGRHVKSYAYTDPNEDAVAVSRHGRATTLVVADGHSGHRASHVAVDAVLAMTAQAEPRWDRRGAVLAFHDVNEQIRAARRTLPAPHRLSRTTLVVAVVDVDEAGQRFVTHASVGDSAVFVLRDAVAYQLTRERHHFLGDRWSAPQVAGAMHFEQTDLDPDDVVVAVSDGFTNFAHPDSLTSLVTRAAGPASTTLDPEVVARGVVDLAGDGGAGDNVAVAVLLPERQQPSTTAPTTDRT